MLLAHFPLGYMHLQMEIILLRFYVSDYIFRRFIVVFSLVSYMKRRTGLHKLGDIISSNTKSWR